MTTKDDTPRAAGPAAVAGAAQPIRRILVFAIIAFALLMMSLDSTIVATALDDLQRGLRTSINWAGWTITAYSFGFVVMLPVSGRLSEQYGRRRVFVASVATFTVASLACGLAGNIYLLIALRAVQAAGGAGLTPSATAIVVDYFGDARDRAVSLFGSIFPVGAMVGPIFGGLFVTYWTWRGIFFVNVPIGLVVTVLALRHIPRDSARPAGPARGLDTIGVALLGIGLLAGMLAASYLGERGAHPWSPLFLVPLALAAILVTLFFRHIHRVARPFIAPRLIHGPGFGPVNLVNCLFSGITSGVVALIPLYAINRYHLSALDSGTLLVAQGAAAIILSITAALALRRTGHRLPLFAGCTVIAIGMALLAVTPVHLPAYAWLAGSAFLIGAGAGAMNPASRNAGLQLAPEHSSTLAALRTMSMQIGSIVTISVATAILASSTDPGGVQAWFCVACALVLLAALPIASRVPEHRGAW